MTLLRLELGPLVLALSNVFSRSSTTALARAHNLLKKWITKNFLFNVIFQQKPATPNKAAGYGKPDLSFVKRVGRRGIY